MTRHTYTLTALLWVRVWPLHMGHREETSVFFHRQTTRLVWLRYIDDIFLIWTHGGAKLEAFIQHTNTFHLTIKFKFNTSPTYIPFLDVMVTLLDNSLHTPSTTCIGPHATHTTLSAASPTVLHLDYLKFVHQKLHSHVKRSSEIPRKTRFPPQTHSSCYRQSLRNT